jgi:type III secretory pathway component EscU
MLYDLVIIASAMLSWCVWFILYDCHDTVICIIACDYNIKNPVISEITCDLWFEM